ncbi:condensation protein [Solihabitans fulvus]|uniref:Condensation protein n=1 Tax=Solihabitans fulvus TaxID=1892852 RepID=A0A5B2WYW7_9PSEU|nr:condensation domain-containing protein [Solihabitans fulvus]KAA2255912.1 condensation protein [Solihabitans fulvus]
MTERILVAFQGEGEGVEELTWGQVGFWQGMAITGQSETMGGIVPVPDGTTVEDAAETLRFVMSRHQALRTRLRFAGGKNPQQVCSSSGEVPLEIVDVGDADPAEVAEAVQKDYKERNFEYETEWPVRMAVIRKDGVVTHAVAVYLHIALDAGGLAALTEELFTRDPNTGETPGPVTAVQPLEQARRQRTPAVLRQSEASLQYQDRVLRSATPSRFGEPKYDVPRDFRQIRYRSPATLLAIRAIARRDGVNTSSALLGCFAVGLARFTGNNPVLAMLLVGNRFRPGFADSVSPLVQLSPYAIDVADVTVGEAILRARNNVLRAYKNAYYDPDRQDEMVDQINADRGEEIDFSCFYNDRRQLDREQLDGTIASAEEIRAAVPLGGYEWEFEPDMPTRKLFLNIDETADAIDFVMSNDLRYFSMDDMVTVARGMEAAAVDAAVEPLTPTGVHAASAQKMLVDLPGA